MADNCLVTKLKGVVDNSTLKKLGEWTFFAPSSGGSLMTFGSFYLKDPSYRIINGSGYFCNAQGENIGTELILYTNYDLYYKSTTELTIAVTGKYDNPSNGEGLVNRNCYIQTDEIKYKRWVDLDISLKGGSLINITAQRSLNLRSGVGEQSESDFLAFLRKCCGTSIYLNIWSGHCDINTSRFQELEQYGSNTFEFRLYLMAGLTGELKNFGYFKVTDLYLAPSCAAAMTGTLEDFISILLRNNPNGGKFKFASPEMYYNVTYKGESLATQPEVLKQDASYINYTSQGVITWTSS